MGGRAPGGGMPGSSCGGGAIGRGGSMAGGAPRPAICAWNAAATCAGSIDRKHFSFLTASHGKTHSS
jgi:hypothetical protein